MPSIGDLFGKGSIAEQFVIWGVLQQLAGAILAPVTESLTAAAWRVDPNVPLSPAAAAELVARGLMPLSEGQHEAAGSGVGSGPFGHLVAASRHGADTSIAIEAMRRGLITEARVRQGLADAGIEPSWHDTVIAMAVIPPSPSEALNAFLEGQVDRGEAERRYRQAGGDPTWFQHAVDTVGQAPTPTQALEMARRGIIPWTGTGPQSISFQQAFLEGPWRNKWLPPFRALGEYLPPPRTVTALVRAGSITTTRAMDLLVKQGLEPDLARAYIVDATKSKAATTKDLTRSEIETMHTQGILTDAQSEAMLRKLGFDATEAHLIVTSGNVRREISAINSAVNRTRTLFTGHKITKAAATNTLHNLGIDSSQAGRVIATWELEKSVNVRQLTPAQIVSAWFNKIMTEAEALAELEAIGYTPFDAWVLLSNRNGKALPGRPAKGPGAIAIA